MGTPDHRPVLTGQIGNAEPVMDKKQFERIAQKVWDVTGIVLQEHKSAMVQSRIVRRLRALEMNDFDVYMNYLEQVDNGGEITHFCNAITTNLTSFFRESHHFDHLRDELAILVSAQTRRVRVWSAGCSTGEEAYCIAMLLSAGLDQVADKKILATDLDTRVLQTAREGIYPVAKLQEIDPQYQRFWTRSDNQGAARFTDALRSLITFNQLNLLGNWPFRGPFDFIFCRNVLIYFDAPTKRALIDRYAAMLRPGGVLYLGHSETILESHPELMPEGKTTYRKRL